MAIRPDTRKFLTLLLMDFASYGSMRSVKFYVDKMQELAPGRYLDNHKAIMALSKLLSMHRDYLPELADELLGVDAQRVKETLELCNAQGKFHGTLDPRKPFIALRAYLAKLRQAGEQVEAVTAKEDFIGWQEQVKDETEGISIEEYMAYASEGNHISDTLDDRKYTTSFTFEEPQIVCFTSDIHLGAQGADLQTMMKDFKFIMKKKILLCINGDAIEGKTIFPKSVQAVITQTLNVHMQIDCITKLLKALRPQMLAYVLGNHGLGNKGGNAVNYMKEACKDAGIDFFQGGCLLTLSLAGKEWRIFMRHKPLSKSKLSPLMGIRKLSTLETAQVYVGSHLHCPTAGIDKVLGKKRICILTGTYATEAPYALDGYGVYGAQADFPCVLFTKDDILLFWSMRAAQLYKEALMQKALPVL